MEGSKKSGRYSFELGYHSQLHIPKADIMWLKEDEEKGLFQRTMSYKDKYGNTRWRKVLKDDRMWFHPPEFPGVMEGESLLSRLLLQQPFFFSRDQLECGVTICAVQGLTALPVLIRKLFCTVVATPIRSDRSATCPAGTPC